MPELPDVEVLKRYVDAKALRRRIEKVEVRDARILEGVSPDALKRELEGNAFVSTRRQGKRLLVRLKDGKWLTLHFGMDGGLRYFEDGGSAEERRDRVVISFEKGKHLAYSSWRMLGRVGLARDFEEFVREKRLGPDALDPNLNFDGFRTAITRKNGPAKTLLLNQEVVAGIGNIYADEILFQARIHPETSVGRLSEEELARLFRAVREVLQTAVDRGADVSRFPQDWLLPHRREGETCPRCGGEMRKVRVLGRSSFYCASCQVKKA